MSDVWENRKLLSLMSNVKYFFLRNKYHSSERQLNHDIPPWQVVDLDGSFKTFPSQEHGKNNAVSYFVHLYI